MDKIKETIRLWWAAVFAIMTALLNSILFAADFSGEELPLLFNQTTTRMAIWILFALFCIIQIVSLRNELNTYTKSKPIIVSHSPYIKDWTVNSVMRGSQSLVNSTATITTVTRIAEVNWGTQKRDKKRSVNCSFALVNFSNNPHRRQGVHIAQNVWAQITYYDANGNVLLRDIKGRWADKPEPLKYTGYVPPTPKYELLTMDIKPNGLPVTLCLAIKYEGEDGCYAYNLDAHESESLRVGEYYLGIGLITAKVTLRGDNLNSQDFEFQLVTNQNQFETVQVQSNKRTRKKNTSAAL